LLPGVGLILGPIALKLGIDELQAARLKPGSSTRPAVAAITLGLLGLAVQLALVGVFLVMVSRNENSPTRPPAAGKAAEGGDGPAAPQAKPSDVKKVPMGNNVRVEVEGDKVARVVIDAVVCMREGPIEQLLTRKRTKEHEAILAADVDARNIHAALLVAGAKEGSPVRYQPRYEPPSGSRIKVMLQYEDKGKLVTVPAQQWIRHGRTGKDLGIDWVFAGSKLVDIPMEENRKYYLANDGDVICVSNFDTALLDLPIQSPQANADLVFEAHTPRIPPRDTKVTVILEPVPEKE
jgi:hypothetical protein